jgi:hypothetical protein
MKLPSTQRQMHERI